MESIFVECPACDEFHLKRGASNSWDEVVEGPNTEDFKRSIHSWVTNRPSVSFLLKDKRSVSVKLSGLEVSPRGGFWILKGSGVFNFAMGTPCAVVILYNFASKTGEIAY